VYIGSADMMTRNTEKRVEVACPIYDASIRARLVRDLQIMLADNVKARQMQSDGTYRKIPVEGKAVCAQEEFMKRALRAERPKARPEKKKLFGSIRKWVRRRGEGVRPRKR
jgi:polyphosphate kinase